MPQCAAALESILCRHLDTTDRHAPSAACGGEGGTRSGDSQIFRETRVRGNKCGLCVIVMCMPMSEAINVN